MSKHQQGRWKKGEIKTFSSITSQTCSNVFTCGVCPCCGNPHVDEQMADWGGLCPLTMVAEQSTLQHSDKTMDMHPTSLPPPLLPTTSQYLKIFSTVIIGDFQRPLCLTSANYPVILSLMSCLANTHTQSEGYCYNGNMMTLFFPASPTDGLTFEQRHWTKLSPGLLRVTGELTFGLRGKRAHDRLVCGPPTGSHLCDP